MARDYRRIAEAMQARIPRYEPTGSAVMDAAMRAIDEAAVAAQARFLERAGRQRRATVEACIETPRLLFRLPFYRLRAAPPLSAADAYAIAIREHRAQRDKARRRHWSFDRGRMDAAWETAVIARFFRIGGSRLWQREAA